MQSKIESNRKMLEKNIHHLIIFWSNRQKSQIECNVGKNFELYLFHGTKRLNIDAICKNNFDWRLSGENGTWYGQGMNMISIITMCYVNYISH